MRSTMNQILATLTAVVVIPAALFAHPGHPGHELSVPPAPVPLTGEDYLTATLVVAGLLAARAMWRRIRHAN